jgi:hypothetical protein
MPKGLPPIHQELISDPPFSNAVLDWHFLQVMPKGFSLIRQELILDLPPLQCNLELALLSSEKLSCLMSS